MTIESKRIPNIAIKGQAFQFGTVWRARTIVEEQGDASRQSSLRSTKPRRSPFPNSLSKYFLAEGDHPNSLKRTVYLINFKDGEPSRIVAGFRADGRIEDRNGEIRQFPDAELRKFHMILDSIVGAES